MSGELIERGTEYPDQSPAAGASLAPGEPVPSADLPLAGAAPGAPVPLAAGEPAAPGDAPATGGLHPGEDAPASFPSPGGTGGGPGAGLPGPASAGCFIAFEGGDGAGKSTQIAALAGTLTAAGWPVVTTREPGGTPLGDALRQLLLHGGGVTPRAEALLFAADRAEHVATIIRPALARGAVVLTDRFADSTLAYQGARGELTEDELATLVRFATGGLRPDLTILLDVTTQTGQARRGGAADRIEAEPGDYHERVRAGFLRLAAADPQRYLVIDAAAPVGDNAARIAGAVLAALGQHPSPSADPDRTWPARAAVPGACGSQPEVDR